MVKYLNFHNSGSDWCCPVWGGGRGGGRGAECPVKKDCMYMQGEVPTQSKRTSWKCYDHYVSFENGVNEYN